MNCHLGFDTSLACIKNIKINNFNFVISQYILFLCDFIVQMIKKLQMKTLQIGLILTILFSSISGCDLIDDSPCGPHKTEDLYLLGSSMLDKAYLNSYLEGNSRVFQWSELVEQVCSDEHVKSNFRIAMNTDQSAKKLNLKARATISWQFLFERKIELVESNEEFKGSIEAGLKQAFPDLNGWFVHTIEVYFPTKGSLAEDEKFLFPRDPIDSAFVSEIISVEMISKFREYK